MKKFFSICILIQIYVSIYGQKCPTFAWLKLNQSTETQVICRSETIEFISELSATEDVDSIIIYWDTVPDFDPYIGQGTRLQAAPIDQIRNPMPCQVCPTIQSIFINACNGEGNESDNEFLIINSGSGFLASELKLKYGTPTNNVPQNNYLNLGTQPCQLRVPSPTLIADIRAQAGCVSDRIIPVAPDDSVPAGASVILFTSSNVTFNYDFEKWCASGQPLYVLQSGCRRTFGAFGNSNLNKTDTVILSWQNCSCVDEFRYLRRGQRNVDGEYTVRHISGTSSVDNGSTRVDLNKPCSGPLTIYQPPVIQSKPIQFNIADFQSQNTNFASCGYDTIYFRAIFSHYPTHLNCSTSSPSSKSNILKMILICPDVMINGPNTICAPAAARLTAKPLYDRPMVNSHYLWSNLSELSYADYYSPGPLWARHTAGSCVDTGFFYISNQGSPVIIHSKSLDSCMSINHRGTVYLRDTTLYDTIRSSSRLCDSIYMATNINILKPVSQFVRACIRSGESYMINGNTYATSGTYIIKSPGLKKCDTTQILSLSVIDPKLMPYVSLIGCDSVRYNGRVYTASATGVDTLKSSGGCDSLWIPYQIEVKRSLPHIYRSLKGCDSVVSDGQSYFQNISMTHRTSYHDLPTCDSLVVKTSIAVYPTQKPIIKTETLPPYIRGSTYRFSTRSDLYSYLWNMGSPKNTWYSDIELNRDTTISITTTDLNGCMAQSSIDITTQPREPRMGLPDIFTPNGDNVNDTLGPMPQDSIEVLEYMIFNRWGELLWSRRESPWAWDGNYKGTPQPAGAYVAIVRYRWYGQMRRYEAHVNLMR